MNHQGNRLRRDMRNNGRIYEDGAKILKESIVSCAKVSKRYNATYGEDDFNDGMLQAAMLGRPGWRMQFRHKKGHGIVSETRSVIRNHAVPARGRPAAAPLRGFRLSSSGWSG